MEARTYTHTTPFDAAAAVADTRGTAAVKTAQAGGLMIGAGALRSAQSGNGDVDALVARRMR